MTFILLLLLLVLLILVHELGHFSVAKLFKIRVDEFGIFFPPRLLSWRRGETEYSLNALPFGGFVRIYGEHPDETDDERSLSRKPRSVQAAVMVAGILFNLVGAWLVLSGGYVVGLPTTAHSNEPLFGPVANAQATILEVLPGSPAARAGIAAEDVIVQAQTATAALPRGAKAQEITDFIAAHQEQSVLLTVLREGGEQTFLARPESGVVGERKAIGVRMADLGILKLPPHLALLQGGYLTYRMTADTAQGLLGFFANLLSGRADFSAVSGPIGIVTLGSAFIKEGLVSIIFLMASLSIALALFNILPIPGLDGGRLLFIMVESIIRRPIPRQFSIILTAGGFIVLILLMLVVSYHDIARLVS